MPQTKRGPERRRGLGDTIPKLEESDKSDERRHVDRRRNSYISQLDLCRGLPYSQIESILERCPTETLAPGEILLEPGRANHHLYFLLTGQLEVRLKSPDSPVADVITAGECVGEMSIIDGQPTSAYVIATEKSTVISVHENVFWSKIAINPKAVRNLTRVLAERMRKRNVATLRALEKEMRLQQLEKELLAAHEIQIGMLPLGPLLLVETPNLDIHARMDVVTSVGGDFYDAFALDDRRVCITIGDVSGKGMPAALFMVRTVTLLRTELIKSDDLAECMFRFNKILCDTNISHMFVSLIVLRIDLLDGTVEYVNAGHPPMLSSRKDKPFFAVDDSKGLIAGVLDDNAYSACKLVLKPDERLLLYTDGVTEARNEERRFYSQQRLIDFLAHDDASDSAELVSAIFEDTHKFSAGTPQSDDITVVAIGYCPAE